MNPFKLEQAIGITRLPDGRFREIAASERALPANPLDVAAAGGKPGAWAPGIGQGTAPLHDPVHRYPPVAKPAPMRGLK